MVGDWEPNEVMKDAQISAVMKVFSFRKALVGGYTSGMEVLAFRNHEVEAYGFDISNDLYEKAIPQIKDYLRIGTFFSIPYGKDDDFDCLFSVDVLEHVRLKGISLMQAEIDRIGVSRMVHLINHTRTSDDHMTLKSMKWWEKKFNKIGFRKLDIQAPESGNSRIYGLNGDPAHVFTFWEEP